MNHSRLNDGSVAAASFFLYANNNCIVVSTLLQFVCKVRKSNVIFL